MPPLAIIQVRMGSRRLPGKALMTIAGRPIIQHVWERSVVAFGPEHVIAAYPDTAENEPLRVALDAMGARRFAWDGPEDDVLGRYFHCAHRDRWHPDSIIVRVTADDPFKDPEMMRRVAAGERLPVELGAEAFTLAMLDAAHLGTPSQREHLTPLLFPIPPPVAPAGCWTIDTQADLDAARAQFLTTVVPPDA
jgi:CMP-2-keto-3-deoxyoctulosonic acid synthetase